MDHAEVVTAFFHLAAKHIPIEADTSFQILDSKHNVIDVHYREWSHGDFLGVEWFIRLTEHADQHAQKKSGNNA
ncbi:hypothetical protein [Ralstonia solanacearum]|uniref:hypothetical protein n=1 Tax=Ralstonia solanacearum TaxID=305 RepID=UPI001E4AF768|nr:hypothetical protein [Ralstonia solanacearum]